MRTKDFENKVIKRIVILGGGSAGWMTAAALSKFLPNDLFHICLIESDEIGGVGVGEATIPHIRQFNNLLAIDENTFIRETGATYKLGIQLSGWGKVDTSYMHPFGAFGHNLNGVDFHHYWLRLKKEGDAPPFSAFSVAVQAALANRFSYPSENPKELLSEYGYAFHLDATLYARFLRQYSETLGVERIEGKVLDAQQDVENGNVESLQLTSGTKISGDIFVDCSGFVSLLLSKSLKTPFVDWSKWLPCDRAWAVASAKEDSPAVFTRSDAKSVGWQWRIPLQHRSGNGYVYCSDYMSDDEAVGGLLSSVPDALADPKLLKFKTGKYQNTWEKNCIAIGLSSGFLEPLESTSLYLIQVGIVELLNHFPVTDEINIERKIYNAKINTEYERVRDFLIAHYSLNQRGDSEFWRYCSSMQVPDSLSDHLAFFKKTGHIKPYRDGLFMEPSWLAMFFGQGYFPDDYDPRVDKYSVEKIKAYFEGQQMSINNRVETLPLHENAIALTQSAEKRQYPASSFSLYGASR